MPSLSAKRQVRYSQADITALDSAKSVLESMREFDKEAPSETAIVALDNAARHVEKRRSAKPAKKAPNPA